MSPETRFWMKVQKEKGYNKCWLWTGAKSTFGYGKLVVDKKLIGAHVFSYRLFKGDYNEDLCVLHKCDNPSCVNPKHLFIGSHKDNTLDMLKKKRHGGLKFTSEIIDKVKELWLNTDLTQEEIGSTLGLDQTYVSKIVNNKARINY